MTRAEIEAVAGGLSKAEQSAVLALSGGWRAGPDMDDAVLDALDALKAQGLVDRQFGDEDRTITTGSAISFRFSACWYFSLSTAGIAVRDFLREGGDGTERT